MNARTQAEGECHPDFEPVRIAFEAVLERSRPGGAALAVYHRGEKVVDLWGGARDRRGTPWGEDTVCMSESTTKGVLAAAVAMAVDRGLLDYDRPVVEWWPEFSSHGKDAILLRHVMCHEAGLFRSAERQAAPSAHSSAKRSPHRSDSTAVS